MSIEILDGGMGEELIKNGVPYTKPYWSAIALMEPDLNQFVVDTHVSFIEAGAQYITTSNYGVTPGSELGERIEELTLLSAQLARQAVNKNGTKVKICGSLPPLTASYRPDLVLPFEEGVSYYQRITKSLAPEVDVFLAETMSSVEEAYMALKPAAALGKDLWVAWTLTDQGTLRDGTQAGDGLTELTDLLGPNDASQLQCVLFNCCTPESALKAIRHLLDSPTYQANSEQIDIGAYPNLYDPVPSDYNFQKSTDPIEPREDLSTQRYLDFAREAASLGVSKIGGCCGIGPEYIRALKTQME